MNAFKMMLDAVIEKDHEAVALLEPCYSDDVAFE